MFSLAVSASVLKLILLFIFLLHEEKLYGKQVSDSPCSKELRGVGEDQCDQMTRLLFIVGYLKQ